jgi:anti-sigma factor RsiW
MSPVHPSRDELLAMAYVDDQLDHDARREFELRLSKEEHLAAEVVALRRLDLIARTAAPPEPIDFAWKRVDESPSQVGAVGAGWIATCLGSLGLAGIAIQLILQAQIPLWERASIALFVGGLTLLFLSVAWRRWKVRNMDPYTSVKR